MITTASGLQYEDTTEGTGAVATKGQNVKVHYTGWLYNNGTQGAVPWLSRPPWGMAHAVPVASSHRMPHSNSTSSC